MTTACRRVVLAAAAAVLAAAASAATSAVHSLRYNRPAEDSVRGWERESLPVGCGHFGASIFGGVGRERVQITHNAVLTGRDPGRECGNLTDALELVFEFGRPQSGTYQRGLDLERGLAWVDYEAGWTRFRREYFASYPARTLAMRFVTAAKGALSFTLRPEIPFPGPSAAEGGDDLFARSGTVRAVADGRIAVDQFLTFFGVRFACRLAVVPEGGEMSSDGASVSVKGADAATVYFTCDTNYRLRPETFTAPRRDNLDAGADPGPRADALLAAAVAQGWDALKATHEADLAALLGRAAVDLGADPADALLTTDALLTGCRNGRRSRYLEETYWQYGRYLLVASSRPGSLPANLQGVWTAHRKSPWGSGYWHNINVQMNYWPAFSANLAECFRPYAEFNAAFRPGTRAYAIEYLRRHSLPDLPKDDEAQDMWCVGTAVWPYVVEGGPGGHSGPGTGGLTTKLFVDWYDFTLDREALERYVWPVVHGMADFLTRCVVETNGLFLSKFSASPEQMVGHLEDNFRWGVDKARYYTTVGCAFDQQMIAENNADCLRLAKELGIEDGVTAKIRAQVAKYDPVQVGADGQIKEFREETHYSDIGQRHHRHISQLVCLMPGTLVNATTPEWLAAARRTLDLRGDESTGWALAHRLCARARAGQGDRAHRLLGNLLSQRPFDTLWGAPPPFQIDGTFGATAGITEMLLQSHAGFVDLLPALPAAWAEHGSFRGLCARGAFEVDCEWRSGVPTRVAVRGYAGRRPDVRFRGKPVEFEFRQISKNQKDGGLK